MLLGPSRIGKTTTCYKLQSILLSSSYLMTLDVETQEWVQSPDHTIYLYDTPGSMSLRHRIKPYVPKIHVFIWLINPHSVYSLYTEYEALAPFATWIIVDRYRQSQWKAWGASHDIVYVEEITKDVLLTQLAEIPPACHPWNCSIM